MGIVIPVLIVCVVLAFALSFAFIDLDCKGSCCRSRREESDITLRR